MLDRADITDSERKSLERVLKRLRGSTSSNGRRITYGDLLDRLRQEAYRQERAGAQELADYLDAAHNVILGGFIEKQDREHFRSRNR